MQKLVGKLVAVAAVFFTASTAFAQGVAAQGDGGFLGLGIGLGIGIAALGGALAQGRASSAALEGISRNPNAADKVFVPMILGLAFIESLVLFTWVLMLLVQQKL